MAVAIARVSSCRSPFTVLSGRAGMCASCPNAGAALATSRRMVAPLLYEFSPVQSRAQLVTTSPRDGQVRGASSGSSRGCFDDAAALLASAPVLPKLVVLDLDFTVWPFYCWFFQSLELLPGISFSADPAPDIEDFFAVDCFLPKSDDAVQDIDNLLLSAKHWASGHVSGHGAFPTAYPQVIDIVRALSAYEVEMAIASRTPSASVAKLFLEQLSISQYFPSKEIYFTLYSKAKHFTALKEKTGIPYSSMLFFDDEMKNVTSAAKLGVTGIVVTEGLDLQSLEKGLQALASKKW